MKEKEMKCPTHLHDSSKIRHALKVALAEDAVTLVCNLFTNLSPELVLNFGMSRKLEETPGKCVGGCFMSCYHDRSDKNEQDMYGQQFSQQACRALSTLTASELSLRPPSVSSLGSQIG